MLKIFVILVYSMCCFCAEHVSEVTSEIFDIAYKTKIISSGTTFKNVTAFSKISCAQSCSTETFCCSASYDNETNACQLDYLHQPYTEQSESGLLIKKMDITGQLPIMCLTRNDCNELPSGTPEGVYTINPPGRGVVHVYCEAVGWTVIQRRLDGTIDFYRDWAEYKNGFGDVAGEYWLGNDNIHTIVSRRPYTLRIDLENFSGETRYAEYTTFQVGDETSNYLLNIGGYSGTAGDLMDHCNGYGFSTTDRDNDGHTNGLCTEMRHGCFWYDFCTMANLNGVYYPGGNVGSNQDDIYVWSWVFGHTNPMKTVVMKIK
ncbi:fibrinogen-like protein A [Mytilus galloprovincialis]|uniref:fibrinogen-like protein A n=1 Tax=Mytilus galloprovincialis TaxID=29158 RepID=UPI003F7B69DA